MTRLPRILAEEYCSDYVEELPADVRLSALEAIRRINSSPERFPNADWDFLDRKHEAILTVIDAWVKE